VEKYSVLIAASAIKELEAVDRKGDRQRIVRAIQALAQDPHAPGCEKLAGSEGRYRVRVGNYRVVYAVQHARRVVDIVKIGHRREVYRS
jgi:mRNA interferase RelE/StbE